MNPFLPIPERYDMLSLLTKWRPIKHRGAGYAQMYVSEWILRDELAHPLLVEHSILAMEEAATGQLPGHMPLREYAPRLRFAEVEWKDDQLHRGVWTAYADLDWKP